MADIEKAVSDRVEDALRELLEAEDGVKAILKVQEVNPDIILLDYHMPKLDGAKAATIITRASPSSKIIIVSMDMNQHKISSQFFH